MSLDRTTLGGEHFGGRFQRGDDGKYYLATHDTREGFKAFFEKRPPRFEGR